MLDRDVTSPDFEAERAWKMIIELRASQRSTSIRLRHKSALWRLVGYWPHLVPCATSFNI
jgi:hypothetical protein